MVYSLCLEVNRTVIELASASRLSEYKKHGSKRADY